MQIAPIRGRVKWCVKRVRELLLLGDDDLLLFRLRLHSLFQLNSSSSAFASCKSLVSKPSVNQQ